jgi:hypothetical protein
MDRCFYQDVSSEAMWPPGRVRAAIRTAVPRSPTWVMSGMSRALDKQIKDQIPSSNTRSILDWCDTWFVWLSTKGATQTKN